MAEKKLTDKADIHALTYKYIDTLIIKYLKNGIKTLNDITLDNLKDFLIAILQEYKKENQTITHSDLMDISDGIIAHFFKKYGEDYYDLPPNDPRSLALVVNDYLHGCHEFYMFPEDADFFIEILQSSYDQQEQAYEEITQYISKFNFGTRWEEANKRGLNQPS